jgi:hypothetical protein
MGPTVRGFPASSFHLESGDWFDNFGIDRNYYGGSDGYLPKLAGETLNENKELAYSIGESFLVDYPDSNQRAVAILKYVQQWTEYGYDSDNVFRDGVAQEEWAWNADEMAHALNPATGVTAVGDCEDMAFLCGTIYVGAGFDAAIVDAPDHVALLIWLPGFSNADNYWDLPNDDRGAGWIWVEATGSSNPLGWTPSDYENGGWTAYPIGSLEFAAEPIPSSSASSSIDIDLVVIIGVVLLSIIGALLRARRR